MTDIVNENTKNLDQKDFENEIFKNFTKFQPDYPDEPLIKLFRSRYFNGEDPSTYRGLDLMRIQIFLILVGKEKFKEKLECLMKLISKEKNKVDIDSVRIVIKLIYKMCTTDMFDIFCEIEFMSRKPFSQSEQNKLETYASRQTEFMLQDIFQ